MDDNNKSLKSKVISSMFWKFCERIGARLVTFVISLILARLLTPDDYGVVALITVFIALLDTVVTSGFGSSLIQRKDADELDFSSVFYFCVLLSCGLYLLLFFAAPWIALFYRNDKLTFLVRVMGLRLLFSGVSTVQNAYVDRNMMFKRYFFSSTFSAIISGVVASGMALSGFGVWSLVAQNLIYSISSILILWFTVRWRPVLRFSMRRMRELYSYGWKLLVSSIITTLYNEIRELVIGRLYSTADLGYYTRGRSFPGLINDNLTATINSVLFPAIAQKQRNRETVKIMTRRSMKTTAYLVMPVMTGLAVVARPLVLLLLTEKWSECIIYLQIACFTSAFTPLQSANLQAIKALGYSGTILKLDIIKRSAGLFVLFLVMRYGVIAIALSTIWNAIMFTMINMHPNKKLLNYSINEQLMDIAPFIGMCAIMAALVYPIQFLQLPLSVVLAMQTATGIVLYIAMSVVFKVDSYSYIRDIAMSYIMPGKYKI